eukprot:617262-Rhodomonas_salina.2
MILCVCTCSFSARRADLEALEMHALQLGRFRQLLGLLGAAGDLLLLPPRSAAQDDQLLLLLVEALLQAGVLCAQPIQLRHRLQRLLPAPPSAHSLS